MSEKKFHPIQSSFLKEAWYDGRSVAHVTFKSGGTWEYKGLKPEIWEGWEPTFQTDESSGKYFRTHIQKLQFTKL